MPDPSNTTIVHCPVCLIGSHRAEVRPEWDSSVYWTCPECICTLRSELRIGTPHATEVLSHPEPVTVVAESDAESDDLPFLGDDPEVRRLCILEAIVAAYSSLTHPSHRLDVIAGAATLEPHDGGATEVKVSGTRGPVTKIDKVGRRLYQSEVDRQTGVRIVECTVWHPAGYVVRFNVPCLR